MPDLALNQLQATPSPITVAGGVVPQLPPVSDPRTTLITEAPTAIAQPPVATEGPTIEATAGQAQPAQAAPEAQPTPADDGMQPLGDQEPQAKRRRLATRQPALKAKAKPVKTVKPKTVKAKAKTVKPKAKAKTVKPKGTTKHGLKHTTTTTKRSPLPSKPVTRKFKPIHFGPCTIYHGDKQRKYRLKESYASRRTTSFNDWAKMMTHIQTL